MSDEWTGIKEVDDELRWMASNISISGHSWNKFTWAIKNAIDQLRRERDKYKQRCELKVHIRQMEQIKGDGWISEKEYQSLLDDYNKLRRERDELEEALALQPKLLNTGS